MFKYIEDDDTGGVQQCMQCYFFNPCNSVLTLSPEVIIIIPTDYLVPVCLRPPAVQKKTTKLVNANANANLRNYTPTPHTRNENNTTLKMQ